LSIRKTWRRVDGVLLLDKPTGMTSNSALQAARRLFSAAKGGHTGTLDPLASGLLPLCFGDATKFAVDLLAADKTYQADLLFGVTTDTGDADGSVVERRPVVFEPSELEPALARLRGPIRQIPPMYSALKRDGKPLYELARQGIEVEREARAVTIHELRLLDFSVASVVGCGSLAAKAPISAAWPRIWVVRSTAGRISPLCVASPSALSPLPMP
jgi:tRNA pseudouridine55 synthase